VYVSFLLFSVLKVCFESLQNVFVSSDKQFVFKCDLSSSHAIYAIKSDVNDYCGILSGSRNHLPAAIRISPSLVSFDPHLSGHNTQHLVTPRTSDLIF